MGDFGERLRQARLQAGFSLREISARTKIREPLLDAIEREDIGRLPTGLVGRGFLRAYAREVGLDPESVVRQFQDQFEAEATPPDPTLPETGGDSDQGGDSILLWRWGLLIVAGLALTAGVTYVSQRSGSGGSSSSDLTATVASRDVSPARISQELEDAVERRSPDVGAAVISASERHPLTVVIEPTGLVWIEATADGMRVLYQLVEAGGRQSIDVREELLLRIGDAGAFKFSINGVPGRALGRSGEVRDIRITHDDYSSFQVH